MKRGVVVGKFLPPHLGHSYLINRAMKMCDQLTVLICDRPEYLIPAKQRQVWLTTIHPNVDFKIIKDTLDDNDSAGWAIATKQFLGYRPDVVFTSEDYGDDWAKYLGCEHVVIDRPRKNVPISATRIRHDPLNNLNFLHPTVRAYFIKRICLVGAESTGTTTLARALAKHYHTVWVPEYGTEYASANIDRFQTEGWKTTDFIEIAKAQNKLEDRLAAEANKVLVCDTDSFATSIWHERYMGYRSQAVEDLAVDRSYDLYLITDVNIPFVQARTRDSEEYRQWMHCRFQEKLRFWGKPYVIVTGSPQKRLIQAIELIDMIINDNAVRLPGLVRNAWHPTGGF